VLEPLAMARSGFPARTADLTHDAVTGYEVTPEGAFTAVPAGLITMPAVGGMWATAADVVRLASGWASLLPAALAREALMPQSGPTPFGLQAGLGWLLSPRHGIAIESGAFAGATAALVCRVRDGQSDGRVYVMMAARHVPTDLLTRRVLSQTSARHNRG
jgi:hypothetical protein